MDEKKEKKKRRPLERLSPRHLIEPNSTGRKGNYETETETERERRLDGKKPQRKGRRGHCKRSPPRPLLSRTEPNITTLPDVTSEACQYNEHE